MRDMVTIQFSTQHSEKRFVTKHWGNGKPVLYQQAEKTMISDLTRSVTRFRKEKKG